MTQDEVNLIYDYLHENYEYVDGNLIANKKLSNNLKCGHILGSFPYNKPSGHPSLITTLCIYRGSEISLKVSHLVFIYHKKIKPKFLIHLNGNIQDCRIENLAERKNISDFVSYNRRIKKPNGYWLDKKSGRYKVSIMYQREEIYIGAYLDESEAKNVYIYMDFLLRTQGLDVKEALNITIEKFPLPKNSNSGFKGVHFQNNAFMAKFRNKYIGRYRYPEEAHAAYLKAKEEYENSKTIPTRSSE